MSKTTTATTSAVGKSKQILKSTGILYFYSVNIDTTKKRLCVNICSLPTERSIHKPII